MSKKWIQHWTQVHSLSLHYKSLNKMKKFEQFIRRVLRQRRQFNLTRVSFIRKNWGMLSVPRTISSVSLATRISKFARSHNVEELKTDSREICSQLSKLQTPRNLSVVGPCITNSTHFAPLTTLCLTRVQFDHTYRYSDIFSGCLMLENLYFNECIVDYFDELKISAPRLVNLAISGFFSYYV